MFVKSWKFGITCVYSYVCMIFVRFQGKTKSPKKKVKKPWETDSEDEESLSDFDVTSTWTVNKIWGFVASSSVQNYQETYKWWKEFVIFSRCEKDTTEMLEIVLYDLQILHHILYSLHINILFITV